MKSAVSVGLTIGLWFLVLFVPPAAAKEPRCERIKGKFAAVIIQPCSDGELCTSGTLTGDVNGAYDFTVTAFLGGPPLVPFIGHSVIQNSREVLLTADVGFTNVASGDLRGLVVIDTPESLTHLTTSGNVNFASGTVAGSYEGRRCPRSYESD